MSWSALVNGYVQAGDGREALGCSLKCRPKVSAQMTRFLLWCLPRVRNLGLWSSGSGYISNRFFLNSPSNASPFFLSNHRWESKGPRRSYKRALARKERYWRQDTAATFL